MTNEQKLALVTGGSSGIGFGIAKAYLLLPDSGERTGRALRSRTSGEGARLGVILNVVFEIDAVRSIVDLVEKGPGWTVMPINSLRRGERPGLSWQRIIKPAIEVTVCLVRPVKSSQTALPTEAAMLARNTLAKLLSEPSGS
jgi:LysR family nitrogen assimilation transcriptional regulator